MVRNCSSRYKLFQKFIGQHEHSLLEKDFRYLASVTQGYSPADITKVMFHVNNDRIKRAEMSTHFAPCTKKKDWYWPCTAKDENAIPMTTLNIPKSQFHLLPIRMEDLERALFRVKKTTGNEKTKQKLKEFLEKYGIDGS